MIEIDGFLFGNIKLEPEITKTIMDLPYYPATKSQSEHTSWEYWLEKDDLLYKELVEKLRGSLQLDHFNMLDSVKRAKLHVLAEKEFIPLHDDFTQNCYAQLLIWVMEDEDYIGREFLYGTYDGLKVFKPKNGDWVLMYNMDKKFIHAVNMLRSDTKIPAIAFELLPY